MTNAIMSISYNNILTNSSTRRAVVLIHGILQAFAGILISIAFTTIMLHKNRNGSSHFVSVHGIFGLIAVVFTIISIIGGALTNYSFQLRNLIRPVIMKIVHLFIGVLSFLLGMIALGYGIYSRWFTNRVSEEIQATFLSIIVLVTLYLMYKPLIHIIQRVKTIIIDR